MNDARGRDAEVQCGVMWPGMQDVVASDHTTQTTQTTQAPPTPPQPTGHSTLQL